ncbi:MAG: potassium transporter Kup [Steroidobacterales bacterium]
MRIPHTDSREDKKNTGYLALGALGIVFGDIGTSPIYAVQACFSHGLRPEPANVLGVISLILWGLTVVVSLKYALLVMRADNHGEGGVFSLLALALRAARRTAEPDIGHVQPASDAASRGIVWPLMLIGMFGAALFFGDSMITPAISVLSAVEGLNVVSPRLHELVLPIAITILVTLFILQRFGSQRIGNSFGPIMVGWFVCLGILGLSSIRAAPVILRALNPLYAVHLVAAHGWSSFAILGAALLAFTGGEALYADMGHFGLKSIRVAWYGLVMPALALNYLGQGALILATPSAAADPLYLMVPKALALPMVVLASAASVIASQAVISGFFSIVREAMQMDYLPRFSVVHTSALERGQVYVPKVNLFLCLSVVILVLLFRSSDALGGAYGFAVAGAMLVDTLLASYVVRHAWGWSGFVAACLFIPLLTFDLTFFTGAVGKIPEGGWLPLSVGILILIVFVTWKQGRAIVHDLSQIRHQRLETLVAGITPQWPARAPGTSVYLVPTLGAVPPALASALNRYQTLPQDVIILKIVKEDVPKIEAQHKATIHSFGVGLWQVVLHYGFMERVNVADDLRTQGRHLPGVDLDKLTFFVGRSIFVPGPHTLRPHWRKKLFLWLANNVEEEFDYSRMPSEQLIQIGSQVEV